MGLPICRATAEAHAGTLRLERGADGGTVAVLRLVVATAPGKVRP
jgi:signal transduction histidine kinase